MDDCLFPVLSVSPSLAWAIAKSQLNDRYCWMVDDDGEQWIVDGMRIAVLVINTCLLLDIIRVLLMKLRKNTTTDHAKYTYILINGHTFEKYIKEMMQ